QAGPTDGPHPPQLGQVRENANGPRSTAPGPCPPHCGQVIGEVPGAAPEPWQVPQGAGPLICTGTVTPFIASSNETRTSVSRSAPRAGAPRRRPAEPNRPPSRSPMSAPSKPWPYGKPSTYTRPPGPPGPPGRKPPP